MDRFELVMMEEIEVKMNNLSIISMAYTFADFFEMHIKRPGHASFEQVNSYDRTFYFINIKTSLFNRLVKIIYDL